jgi:LacI family transcriptional regulator, galactose operon repressor
MKRSVRMRDVAAVAGVDTSVVSRVLSGDERLLVRPETRERVLDAVERLGYRPNPAAQMLKTARAMAIGMVVPDFANPAYSEIARGAEERAAELGYILLLASGSVEDRLPILRGRVDGLLYAIATSDSGMPARLPSGLDSLLVNRREPGLGPSIVVDDEAAAALATRHLIGLGHRRIAHIAGPATADTGRRRLAGYIGAMNAAGIPVSSQLIQEARFDEAGGFEATKALLDRGDPPPTAIFVANTRAAIGAVAACDVEGKAVPGDISIVGLDEVPIARYLHPPLTTVQRPLSMMGSRAVDMLLKLIDGESVEDVVLDEPSRLIERASSAPPADAS